MKRTRLVTGSLVVLTLTAAACGSSGPKTLSEGDFVTQMNAICRTADRSLNKLDPSDKSFFTDITDVIQTGLDDFGKLKPPKSLKADFDDYTANLDDQLTQFEKLGKAVKSGDTAAQTKANDKLTKLSTDGDDLATSLGADKCVGVGSGEGGSVTTDTTADTASDTTAVPDTTTPETSVETTTGTVTPNTPLPIDTTPDTVPMMTVPPSTTSSSGGVQAGDASTGFSPIDGYSWGTLEDIASTQTPSDDPVIGPLLAGYYVGVMESNADGSPVYVYVTVLKDNTVPWTPTQLAAYYNFELVGDGTDVTLPTIGLPARTKVGAVEGYDAAVFTINGVGVSILAPTGSDPVQLLEGFVIAQSAG
jgi:hypothetical protein